MYLTKKKKQAIIRNVWQMHLSEIDASLTELTKHSPRNRQRRLLAALRAAKLDEAMASSIAAVYLTEFRIIPSAFYWLAPGKSRIYFQGDRLERTIKAESVSLGLVHPQIYR